MFLKLYLLNRVIIKVQWRLWCLLYFTRKNNLLRLFVGIRVESHIRLGKSQTFILLQSLFKLVADKFILSTTEKSETLSAKTLTFVVRPSKGLFIYIYIYNIYIYIYIYYIKNNNGIKVDPCGTPDSKLNHEDSWPFKTTLCFLSFKKSVRELKRLPDMPFLL